MDESTDLSGTMAALDAALRRAGQFATWLGGGSGEPAEPDASAAEPEADPPGTPPDASAP
jgi:hypothetical protein